MQQIVQVIFALLLQLLLFSKIDGKFVAKIQFLKFQNSDGTTSDSRRCDTFSSCDTYFHIILNVDGIERKWTSERINNQNSFVFGSKIINLPNPLVVFSDRSYSGKIKFEIKAMDHDRYMSPDTVVTFRSAENLKAKFNGNSAATKTIKNLRGTDNSGASISLSLSVHCSEKYFGDDCLTFCDETEKFRCAANGQRICKYSFTKSSNCEQTFCEQWEACENGATCVNLHNNYKCECTGMYKGINCTIPASECIRGTPCRNNGTCESDGSGCSCLREFTGEFCELDVNECDSGSSNSSSSRNSSSMSSSISVSQNINDICQNNGSCINEDGGYICECEIGWTGSDCSIDVDECDNYQRDQLWAGEHVCNLRGLCHNFLGGFRCECQAGFQGQRCEEDKDECKIALSENRTVCNESEICINSIGSYACYCKFLKTHDGKCSSSSNSGKDSPKNQNFDRSNSNVIWILATILSVAFAAALTIFILKRKFNKIKMNQQHQQQQQQQQTASNLRSRNSTINTVDGYLDTMPYDNPIYNPDSLRQIHVDEYCLDEDEQIEISNNPPELPPRQQHQQQQQQQQQQLQQQQQPYLQMMGQVNDCYEHSA